MGFAHPHVPLGIGGADATAVLDGLRRTARRPRSNGTGCFGSAGLPLGMGLYRKSDSAVQ